MNTQARWRTVLIAAALPLLYLPLRAAEAPPTPSPPAQRPGQPAAEPPPQSATVDNAPEDAAVAPARVEEPAQPRERVSVDNNLTFPVDI